MNPIIKNNNNNNNKNISNLLKQKNKNKKDINSFKKTLNLFKIIDNLYKKDETQNKRKNKNYFNGNYTFNTKYIQEIIKKMCKSVAKEKIKLKSSRENMNKNKTFKSPNLLNSQKRGINKTQKENQILNNEKEYIKRINIVKFNDIKEKEIKENKKLIKQTLNDSSNISLPPLLYSNQLFKFNKPLLIGLNNLGSTCYLNSILQCLNQTEPLTNYFLSDEGISKIKNNNLLLMNDKLSVQLSPSYLEVVNNLWDKKNNNKAYSPIHFSAKLNEINKNFILNKPNDSKELLKFIFNQFHKELNKKIPKPIKINKKEFEFEEYDRIKTFNNFLVDFTYNNCSIISNNFYGINEIHKECIKCNNFFISQGIMINPIIYDFKIYDMLSFPLEEVKKMKLNNSKDKENMNKITIYDCFDYYQNKKSIIEKKIYCKRCMQSTDFIIRNKLFNAPNILIIILNRGKGNSYNIKIEFFEKIDLTNYISFNQNKVIYNLYGVVTHLGKNKNEGHFIASCKNLIDNSWYKYNDSSITKINNIQKEVLDFNTPYILFFQKNI